MAHREFPAAVRHLRVSDVAGAHAFTVDCSQNITLKQEPSMTKLKNRRNLHTKLSGPYHIDQNKITTAPISCGIPRNPKPEANKPNAAPKVYPNLMKPKNSLRSRGIQSTILP